MRKVFLVFTGLLLVAVIAQFYLATFGAFERPLPEPGTGAIVPHAMNGTTVIPILSLLTTIIAAVARAGRRLIALSAVPLVVVIGQLFVIFPLVELTGSTMERTNTGGHIVFGFHAILGVLMLGAAVTLFQEARTLARAGTAAPIAEPHTGI
ncbi:DUF6220 domain-containing protein [Streptosporangium subroseum]|uniref:DUF6220 domain-containing protein n=1 Tax=Streptosporangium subroseum TaxID=106412 RepID=UPI00343A19C5